MESESICLTSHNSCKKVGGNVPLLALLSKKTLRLRSKLVPPLKLLRHADSVGAWPDFIDQSNFILFVTIN